MQQQQQQQHDYLAVIRIGTGSSFGRAPDKEAAIKNAVTALKDWTVYYDLSDKEITVNVMDVQGYSDCSWCGQGTIRGTNEATGKDEPISRHIEHVQRRTPKWRKPKRG